jgi:hypothetical protein
MKAGKPAVPVKPRNSGVFHPAIGAGFSQEAMFQAEGLAGGERLQIGLHAQVAVVGMKPFGPTLSHFQRVTSAAEVEPGAVQIRE